MLCALPPTPVLCIYSIRLLLSCILLQETIDSVFFKAMPNLGKCITKQRHHFASKGLYSESYGFSSSHAWVWKLNHKEGRVLKNWCFWVVVLKKTLESPLNCKEIKPVHPKGNQPWIFIGRTDAEAEAEAPILWPPDVKSRLIGKDPDAGKNCRHEEKGATEDEMVGCHHWLDGHEFEGAPGVGDGQGGLLCSSPWGPKESDTTEQLKNNKMVHPLSRLCLRKSVIRRPLWVLSSLKELTC